MASLIQPSRSFEYELDEVDVEDDEVLESEVVLAVLAVELEELSEELDDAELLELELDEFELRKSSTRSSCCSPAADFESAGNSMVQPVTIRFGSVNVRPSGSDLFLLSENS